MLAGIWAQSQNGLIGQDDGFKGMPWELPNDLKHFQNVTTGGTVVMGRKSFEAMGGKALKNRENIVLTTRENYEKDDIKVFHNTEDVLKYAESVNHPVYIIGGASVFAQFMDNIDRIYRTVIHETFDGDTYMTDIDWDNFKLVESIEGTVDEKNKYPHTFEIYDRIS